ncbi:MAG: tetratricopeptide repeat protein [Myxococcota bacterium]|nr:tetratricopeptide repeat protein [Myxococcota bacterium]
MRRLGYSAVFALVLSWLPASGGAVLPPPVEAVDVAQWAVPTPVGPTDESASLLSAAWPQEANRSLDARVEAARDHALRLGSPGVEGAARWLLSSATVATAGERARLAQRLAPDLPAAHAAVARARFQSGSPWEALRAGWEALRTLRSHTEARFWTEGSLLVIVTAAAVAGGLFFLLLVGVQSFSGAAHDLGDFISPAMPEFSRVAFLASLVLVPLVLGEGWGGLALAFFTVAVAFGGKRTRVAALLAVAVFLLGLFPLAHHAGRNLVALGADPVASAVHALSLDREGEHDRAVLEQAANRDSLAALALAVRARREGREAEAKRRYSELLARRPGDPVVLVNLANLHLESGEPDRAIALYRRAAAFGPSVTVLFNLAQAHARSFEVAKFDRVMTQAQELDSSRVEELSKLGGEGFVVDVPISREVLRNRFLAAASGEGFHEVVRQRVAPGLLGHGGAVAVALFAACGAIGLGVRSRFEPSSRCRRCSCRICARCDGSVWNGRLCDACHHLFQTSAATESARHRSRLAEIEGRRRHRERMGIAASWCVPGLGGVRQGRPDRGLVGVLLFFGTFFAWLWMDGVVPGAGVVGGAGSALLGALALGFGVLYIVLLPGSVRFPRRVEP